MARSDFKEPKSSEKQRIPTRVFVLPEEKLASVGTSRMTMSTAGAHTRANRRRSDLPTSSPTKMLWYASVTMK